MKEVILLDSSLIVAYSNQVDENHTKAKQTSNVATFDQDFVELDDVKAIGP